MAQIIKRYGIGLTTVFFALAAFWMLALVWVPYSIMIEQSFRLYLPFSEINGPRDVYTLANYASLFDSIGARNVLGIDIPIPIYIFLLTVLYSCLVTVLCFAFAYPMAWILAKRVAVSAVPLIIMLLIIPMFVSELLRTYAWYIILAFQGPLNAFLGAFGIGKIRWLTGYNGVIVGMIYTYILFMFFPIYNSLTSLDTNQIDAARDLGARWWEVHRFVALPHAKSGISSGCTMVFMFAVGSVLVPTMLGSPSSRWFTEIILRTMFESQDWNTASAYAFLILLVCLVFVSLVMRLFRVNLADVTK